MKNKLIDEGKLRGMAIEINEDTHKKAEINTLNDKVNLFQITNVQNYRIKAIKNGKSAKIVCESLDDIEEILDDLENILSIQDNDNQNELGKGTIVKEIEDEIIDLNLIKKNLLELNDLKKTYENIVSIETSFCHYYEGRILENSACNLVDQLCFNEYGAALTVGVGENKKVAYVTYYSTKEDFAGFREAIIAKLNDLQIKLNSSSVTTKKYKVLLTNNVVTSILATFADAFNSKNIYLHDSVLENDFQKLIFSPKITMVDDASKGIIPISFDDEGSKTKKNILINKGVFQTKINNIEYALKLNEETTGNASGVNYLYIESGQKDYLELVKELKNGIIIDEAYGFHAGVDKSNGDISVQAEGMLVEDGKIIKGLNMIILSTNFKEVFKNVLEVGCDCSSSNPEVCAPSLLLEDITITGGE